MSWLSTTLTSSIGRKIVMALTGLFLCTFLIVHLVGNFQLLAGDGGVKFNLYAKFMTTFPLVKALSYGLYAGFALHIIQGLMLIQSNKAARGANNYAYSKPEANSSWTSRSMGLLGMIILLFFVGHMAQFWGQMHFGTMPMVTIDGIEHKDLFKLVSEAFKQPLFVGLYVLSMVALGFHLWHGFQSAFQTLGLNHQKYSPFVEKAGYGFAVVVPIGYAIIPIIMFLS